MASAPYYWKERKGWYLKQQTKEGRKNTYLGKTKDEAMRAYAQLAKTGFVTAAEDPPLLLLIERWLKFQDVRVQRSEVSAEWLGRVQRDLVDFTSNHPGLTVQQVTPAVVQAWLHRPDKPLAADTERTRIRTLQQMMRWGVLMRIIASSPLAGMPLPPAKRREVVVTELQHLEIIEACSRRGQECDWSFVPLLETAWATGSRPGELRGLKWDQISDDYTVAKLTEHKSKKKTGRPRTIYFPKPIQRLLRLIRHNGEYVFLNARGKPFTKNAITHRMRRIRKATGIDGVVAYSYRHAYATRAIVQGVDVATVAELMGHASLEMISKHYGHLAQETKHLTDAANAVK